jgi:D-arginine dehydrogenase
MTRTYDAIVIGGGIAGASVAYALSRDARVLILEMETQPGYHSTSRSAAVVSLAYGPKTWQILTAASAAFYMSPPAGFSHGPLTKPLGALYLARSGEERELQGHASALSRRGVVCELIAPSVAKDLAPVVHMEEFRLGLHEPGCVDLDASALLHGYLNGAKARSAEMILGTRSLVIEQSKGAWRISFRDATVTAPILINAAGAWAGEVAIAAGISDRGVRPLRRTAITFDPPQGYDARRWPMTFDVGETWYFKPEGRHIMMSPCDLTPTPPCDAQPEEFDVAVAVDRIETATSMKVGRLKSRWAGLRTFAADHEAVIGPDPDNPAFVWYAGQGGSGVMASWAGGEACAALALGRQLPAAISDLDLTIGMISPARLSRP